MTSANVERLRNTPPVAEITDRQAAAQRFEQALQGQLGQGSSGGGDQEGNKDSSQKTANELLSEHALSPDVMRLFRQSLDQGISEDDGSGTGALLDVLLKDIADGVRTRRRGAADRWRLTIRLRPEILPLTEVEIACMGGELSVTLRTASETAYRTIVDALPALDAALQERDYGSLPTTVFLIGPEELQ